MSINGGYQVGSQSFSDVIETAVYQEFKQVNSSYSVDPGVTFDVSGGAAVWRWLGVGVGMSRYSKSYDISASVTVPHPFYFNRDRAADADPLQGSRKEQAVHLQAVVLVPSQGRI